MIREPTLKLPDHFVKCTSMLIIACGAFSAGVYAAQPSTGEGGNSSAKANRVAPPPPQVATIIEPGLPERDKQSTERGHGKPPKFNTTRYRQRDGGYARD
jgi:hypothetical protein